MDEKRQELATILRTSVPLMKGFAPDQILVLLQICSMKNFKRGEILMESDTPSNEMYLILSGEVLVRTSDNIPLARLSRPETVGEMGIFTGEPRSATVEVLKDGNFVLLSRADLLRVLAKEPAMAVRMYKNVVEILSNRLRNENLQVQIYGEKINEMQAKIPASEGPPLEEGSEGHAEAIKTIDDFYHATGGTESSAEQRTADLGAYSTMREQGFTDAQIRQGVDWTAKNIRGVKDFTMVRYTITKALKKP